MSQRLEILLAAVFAGTSFTGHPNAAAVLEWVISIVFTFYVLTFFIDLLPASRNTQEHSNQELLQEREMENGQGMFDGSIGHANGTGSGRKPTPRGSGHT